MYRLFINTVGLDFRPLITPRYLECRFLATGKTTDTKTNNINNTNNDNKANSVQLAQLEEKLVNHLPKFFQEPHPFHLYSPDVVFVDNIRGVRAQGRTLYGMQLYLVKAYHFVRYYQVKLKLLNLVKNPEDSCIRIRWRIIGLRGPLSKLTSSPPEVWKDGISTIYANSKGEIYCHVCDNIDLEQDDAKQKSQLKNPLVNRGLNVNIKRTVVT